MNGSSRTILHGMIAASAWSLGLRLVFLVLVFGATALLARLLPPAVMGGYLLCLSVAGFVALAVNIGLPGLAVREIGRNLASDQPRRADRVAADFIAVSARMVAVQLAGGAVLVGAALLGWLEVGATTVLLTSILAGAIGLQALVGEIYRGYGRIVEAAIFNGTLAAAVIFLLVALVPFSGVQLTLEGALGLSIVGTCLGVLIGILRLRLAWGGKPVLKAGRLFADARAFWTGSVATFALMQADFWVAGMVLPLEQVALYGAAMRMTQPLALPIEAAEASLNPRIVKLHASGATAQLADILPQFARLQFAFVLAGWIVLAVAGESLLGLVFGPSYVAAYPVLLLLGGAWCVRAATGAFGPLMFLTEHGALIAGMTVGAALLAVAANWIAGWLWGMVGVAAAAAFVLSCFCILGTAVASRLTGLRTAALWPPSQPIERTP